MKIIQYSFLDFLFKYYDANKNGILDKDEIGNIHKDSYFDCTTLEEGMDIFKLAEKNISSFRGDLLLNNKEYQEGRQILQGDEFIHTEDKRQMCEDDPNSSLVEQGRYAIKTYSQDTPTMQTYNVCDCVAVTVYDKESKKGFMAHCDVIQTAEKIDELLDSSDFNPETSEVRIIGGHSNCSEAKIEIIEDAINKHNLKIVEYDILGENSKRNIQLDLNTGELFDYEETEPFKYINDFSEKYGLELY